MSAEDEVLGGLALSGIGIDVRTYRRADCPAISASRYPAFPVVSSLAEQFAITVTGLRVGYTGRIHRPDILTELRGNYKFRDICTAE